MTTDQEQTKRPVFLTEEQLFFLASIIVSADESDDQSHLPMDLISDEAFGQLSIYLDYLVN